MYAKRPTLPQGLGTGALYTNNFPVALSLQGDQLRVADEPLPALNLLWNS